MRPGFVVTYPLYTIVRGKEAKPLVAISEDEDQDEEFRGVALFTELLFAERTRDQQMPDADILTINSEFELQHFCLPLFKKWGYRHVAIDTHEKTGRGWYIPIEDLEA